MMSRNRSTVRYSTDDEWFDALSTDEMDPETLQQTVLERNQSVDQVRMSSDYKKKKKKSDGGDSSYAKALRGTIYLPSINLDEEFDPPVYPKTPAEEKFLQGVFHGNFLFADLSSTEIQKLINTTQHERFVKDKIIVQQGAVGDFFYIVESGKVDFILDGDKHVGECGPAGCFGELALLYNSPRAVSCVAASDTVELFKVEQTTFRTLLARHTSEHESKLKGLLQKVSIFKDLSDDEMNRFTSSLTPVHWKEGSRIVQKGEEGKVFYILQEGSARVHDIGTGDSANNSQMEEDHMLGPGDWFGERALLTGEPRAANVTAVTAVTTMAMDRDTFESHLGSLQHLLEREKQCRFLKGLPVFGQSKLTDAEYNQLADVMQQVEFPKGDTVAEAGKPHEMKLWIIRAGRLLLYLGKPEDSSDVVCDLQSGDTFGEKFIGGEENLVSRHTAVCQEDLTAWVLTRKELETVLGDIGRLGGASPLVQSVHLSDLTRHRVLGEGAFGKVFLVSCETNQDNNNNNNNNNETTTTTTTTYALKSISKHKLIHMKQVDSVMGEKEMLSVLQHPFILRMVSSFQDENYVYLLLHVIQGGELFRVLQSQKQRTAGLPNTSVAFYAACIIEALGYFHQRKIAYRDLKLENILIDAEGYCVVVDLGFAKVVTDKTYSLVGTPEYLAPEILTSKGHNKASDYWAFGVLVYELFVGQSPFYKDYSSQLEMFMRAVRMQYTIPDYVDEQAKDMIQRLLQRNPNDRLGNLARGHLDVKRHKWFEASSINFESLIHKEEVAPWIPQVKDNLDASNFDVYQDNHNNNSEEDYGLAEALTEEEQDLFKGF